MRWIWFVWLIWGIPVFGQIHLKPGGYKDLKPTKPIVLDTGSYMFVGLEMKNLGKDVWLDGRRARTLTLVDCRFEGNGEGVAVLSSGDLTVSQSKFTNMGEGIVQESPKGSHRKVSVLSNVFRDNDVSIRLSVEKGKAETDWKSFRFAL